MAEMTARLDHVGLAVADLGAAAAWYYDLVPPAQSIRLAEALRAAGATAELELVPGATHMWNGAGDVDGIVRRSVEFLRTATPGAGAR
jgi:dienelactone hydrolase